MSVRFVVPGVPAPGGSKKAFVNPRTGRIVVLDDARNNAGWRQRVAVFASQAMAGKTPMDGPLVAVVRFRLTRPKDHYHTGRKAGQLKPWAEAEYPIGKPDATKLWRAAEDAMKGIVWQDDAQVVWQDVRKVYGEAAGCEIHVYPAPPPVALVRAKEA